MLDFIRRATDDRLVIEEGALYPALHRMERRGWLLADWGVSEKGRRGGGVLLTRGGAADVGGRGAPVGGLRGRGGAHCAGSGRVRQDGMSGRRGGMGPGARLLPRGAED